MKVTKFVDARLVPVALGLWLGSAVTTLVGLQRNRLADIFAAVIAAVFGLAIWQLRSRLAISIQVLMPQLLFSASLGAIFALTRLLPILTSPAISLAQNHSIIKVRAIIAGDPKELQIKDGLDWGSQNKLLIPIKTVLLEHSGRQSRVKISAQLFAKPQQVQNLDLIPGTEITLLAKLSTSYPGSTFAFSAQAVSYLTAERGPPTYQWLATSVRNRLHLALIGQSPEAQALVPGLALGDSQYLTPAIAKNMRAAGLSHLIAVSGANITILLSLVFVLLAGTSRMTRFIGAGLALIAFVVLVRPEPSVLRASVMGAVALLGFLAQRKTDPFAALAIAVSVLVILDPLLSASYGFALSVFATVGLLLFARRISSVLAERLSPRIPQWVVDALAVTVAAQIAVLPVLLLLGATISLATIPANCLAVPLATVTMIFGLGLAVLACIYLPFAKFLAVIVAVPAWLIAKIAQACESLTFLQMPFPSGIAGVCYSVVLLTFVALALTRWQSVPQAQRNSMVSVLILFIALLWLPAPNLAKPWPATDWVMVSCDVGQGDATVLNLGQHRAVLIDVGPNPELLSNCLTELQIKSIPLLVLTHFHADHVGGLAAAFAGRKVGQVKVSPLTQPLLTSSFVFTFLAEQGRVPKPMVAGENISVGGLSLKCIWPAELIRGQGSDANNASVVLLATIRKLRILLAGDVEAPAQAEIVHQAALSEVTVLKIAHHGSRNQDDGFAKMLRPKIALISVGAKNMYGHPATQTLTLYESLGSRIFRTDLSGSIAVREDSGRLKIVTQR
ncbi:MAG: DNA internalization-related competence protein ComEC/Rec2 [Actinomycetales bacterium]|nr:DNA internalization-related competence protein ComEC/Rec2 [Actinomycetales bacterium]